MSIFIGNQELLKTSNEVTGDIVTIEGESYYKIENYDSMAPFFMSIVSSGDHWMFISSTGGLTAGRANPDKALFPYYTDDKIHESSEITGSKTIILLNKDKKTYLWEAFSRKYDRIYKIKRNLYKNRFGNKIVFEEINSDLELTFRYSWQNSEKFGWIKRSELINNSSDELSLSIVDGLQNLLPYGVEKQIQEIKSTLLDGYKKCELLKDVNLGLFRLSSIPVDRAEPSEALKVNTVFAGVSRDGLSEIENLKVLLSSSQLDNFRKGEELTEETETRGIKGAYFLNFKLNLKADENKEWYFSADLEKDYTKVIELTEYLKSAENILADMEENIEEGTAQLNRYINQADGIQESGDKLNDNRHYSNVMFNIMRGGIFNNGYMIDKSDFMKHIKNANKVVYTKFEDKLDNIADSINYNELIDLIESFDDSQLLRLSLEYLPLTFSRRHGDPSRPWNMFDIKIKDENGNPSLFYQGNWRDIFQNWEALAMSYPEFIPGMIAKFLNASTLDGYNPYRITRDGIDWEVHDPTDPWSNIGYWGDHQIIYLLKFLELSKKFYPENLKEWMNKSIFAYANVPYKIKNYEELLKNPQDTILFDDELEEKIKGNVEKVGSDAKLLLDENSNDVVLVNFTEKILATLLSKMTNFIPEAGIWMNTQRPEWNDANNALVGYGVSMVTLYYIRRFAKFFIDFMENINEKDVLLTSEIKDLTLEILEILKSNKELLNAEISDEERKRVTDKLGTAGSDFREKVYNNFSNSKTKISFAQIKDLFELIMEFTDHSIKANRCKNGLYHAYNIISLNENEFKIDYLYDMLEGQTAVLSSGMLGTDEVLDLLGSLYSSELYREDQNSFVLYPDKKLPEFLEKNVVSKKSFESSELLKKLVEEKNTEIITKDNTEGYHFNGSFNNKDFLEQALDNLSNHKDLVKIEKTKILAIYEEIFNHKSFTGRSGTFYKYEGLGCIYWHMVSKLLLAVGESIVTAKSRGESEAKIAELSDYYYKIKAGIGAHKNPKNYGAFPTDPYSHTPSMAGVQQPGMTGQVKEDILSRLLELGIDINEGKLSFKPIFLQKEMFREEEKSINFTYCTVAVKYSLADEDSLSIKVESDGKQETISSNTLTLSEDLSKQIFSRTGLIKSIEVKIKL